MRTPRTLHSFFQQQPQPRRLSFHNSSNKTKSGLLKRPAAATDSGNDNNNNNNQSSHKKSKTTTTVVKQERSAETQLLQQFENIPQNMHESKLLSELKQMGFQDEDKDILMTIRQCVVDQQCNNNSNSNHDSTAATTAATVTSMVTSDVVMMKLVAQREAMDEARKEDKARMESERRQHAALLRESAHQNHLQQLYTCAWEQVRTQHFSQSYLLHDAQCSAALQTVVPRRDVVALLELERKAQKWYKMEMPRPYFASVLARRLGRKKENVGKMVRDETAKLQHALYTLEEQSKLGVPLLFLEAYDAEQATPAAKKDRPTKCNGNVTKTTNHDDDDDDVVVVMTSPSPRKKEATAVALSEPTAKPRAKRSESVSKTESVAKATSGLSSTKGKATVGPSTPPLVIDLLE
eukprot:CAMPEP_0168747198 /NCGR_PEP_ID=MMETSP0724-20121128/15538_1 /TAXON_ID=265536 /ORGANISM="Amphiprora sp., Strain CCMP467" /LENGTH=406 /DNA_ID=CAMNT_0008794991 /DNA_START=42 /DNA_END=1262 /DNA_ORIENTATION=-